MFTDKTITCNGLRNDLFLLYNPKGHKGQKGKNKSEIQWMLSLLPQPPLSK